MIELEEAERINRYLESFGCNIFNQPLFRLVWSSSQLEKRTAIFSDYAGDLFLREVEDTREVPKYWYKLDRWMFERWFPPEVIYDEEVPDSKNGDYLCLYVFEDNKLNKLPLRMRVIEILMDSIMHPRTASQIKAERDKKKLSDEKLEQEYFDRVIDGSDSGLGLQLHWGEAGLVPSNYEGESPNLRTINE